MQNVRILLGIGAGLLTAVAVACSSSSGNPSSPTGADAGDDGTVSSGDDGSMAGSCIPLGSTGCSMGQECCLDPANITSGGACVAQGSCNQNIAIGCEKTNDCSSGQVCCADLGGVDAGALAALADGGLAALGIDASAISLDAGTSGLGGLGGALGNIDFKVRCAASCTGMQIQACAMSNECKDGATCVPLTQLGGDAGNGILGDAGLPAGLSMYAGALGMVGACVPPVADAGTTPPVDSGIVDSGMEDVVVPTDAPADSPAE